MQEVPGSCCGWDISCSDLQLSLFSSVQPNAGIVTQAINAAFRVFRIYFLFISSPFGVVCTSTILYTASADTHTVGPRLCDHEGFSIREQAL
jgi:hypothetical protein